MGEYDFYKELYHKENERRQEVVNALNIPLVIITALSTVVYILITTFSYSVHWFPSILFVIGILATVTLLITAIHDLSRAFVDLKSPYEYEGLPFSRKLFDYRRVLKTYCDDNFVGESEAELNKRADKYFKQYLTENFLSLIDHNTYVNDQELRFIFNSKRYLIYCLISCLITLLPFWWGYFLKEADIHRVEIVQFNKQSHEQPKPESTTATGGTTATTTSAPAKQIDQRRSGASQTTPTGRKIKRIKSKDDEIKPSNTVNTNGTAANASKATGTAPKQGN